MPSKGPERIYSVPQLLKAVRSAVSSLKEQLNVLTILDGTAVGWPGVSQATTDLETIIEKSLTELTSCDNSRTVLQEEAQSLRQQVSSLQDNVSSLTKSKDKLQNDLRTKTRELGTTQTDLSRFRQELKEQTNKIKELEVREARLVTEVDSLNEDNDELQQEVRGLRDDVNQQLQTISELNSEVAAKRSDVQHLTSAVKDTKQQLDSLRKEHSSVVEQLRQCRNELLSTTQSRDEYKTRAKDLQTKVTELQGDVTHLQNDITRLKDLHAAQKRAQDIKLQEEQQKHLKTHEEFNARVSSLQKEVSDLNTVVRNKDEELRVADAVQQATQKDNERLEGMVGDLRLQLQQMTDAKTQAAQQLEKAQKTAADLQEQLKATALDKEKLKLESKLHVKHIEKSEAENQSLRTEIQGLQQQVQTLQHEVQGIAVKNEHLKQKVQTAEQRAKESTADRVAQLQLELQQAMREAAVNKAITEGVQRDARGLQERLTETDKKAATTQETADRLRSELEQLQRKCSQEMAVLETRVKDMTAQLDSKAVEINKVRTEASLQQKQMQSLLERLQRENDASAVEIDRLRQQAATHRLPPLMGRGNNVETYAMDDVASSRGSDRYLSHTPTAGFDEQMAKIRAVLGSGGGTLRKSGQLTPLSDGSRGSHKSTGL